MGICFDVPGKIRLPLSARFEFKGNREIGVGVNASIAQSANAVTNPFPIDSPLRHTLNSVVPRGLLTTNTATPIAQSAAGGRGVSGPTDWGADFVTSLGHGGAR